MNTQLLTILLGCTAGIFGGGLGQSGVELMVPGLLLLNIVPNFKTAAGTVLLTLVPPVTLLAAYQYYKRGQTQIITSATLFISYFIMAFVGAYLTKNISNKLLELIVSIYFFCISILFLCMYWYK